MIPFETSCDLSLQDAAPAVNSDSSTTIALSNRRKRKLSSFVEKNDIITDTVSSNLCLSLLSRYQSLISH
jgi:hypothetical protein